MQPSLLHQIKIGSIVFAWVMCVLSALIVTWWLFLGWEKLVNWNEIHRREGSIESGRGKGRTTSKARRDRVEAITSCEPEARSSSSSPSPPIGGGLETRALVSSSRTSKSHIVMRGSESLSLLPKWPDWSGPSLAYPFNFTPSVNYV
jgi:hypothetical protein